MTCGAKIRYDDLDALYQAREQFAQARGLLERVSLGELLYDLEEVDIFRLMNEIRAFLAPKG